MPESRLPDRAILIVSGADAEALLNRLVTRDVSGMERGEARYAALLSPQGKLQFDFLVWRQADGLLLDCARDQVEELARKLTMFKLRAKVAIVPQPELAVAAAWGDPLDAHPASAYRDPRHEDMGWRIVAPASRLADHPEDVEGYERHRIALGVPKGGQDFVYGDAFVHEANLDLLRGVDFDKGCYVGQEVVSRVHHRNSARRRIVKVHVYGDPPAVGAALTAGQIQIGTLTSLAGHDGLAGARIDRLMDAEAAKQPVLAGEALVGITPPDAVVPRPTVHAEG